MPCWKIALWTLLLSTSNVTSPNYMHDTDFQDDHVDENIIFENNMMIKLKAQTYIMDMYMPKTITPSNGNMMHFCQNKNNLCQILGKFNKWKNKHFWISSKLRNKIIKIKNGNRTDRNIVKIQHWNAGNSLWQNKKLTIEALITEKTPDLLFISEANLMSSLPDQDRQIHGYELYLPLTMDKHKCSRIVLLVREGVNINIQHNMMHEDVAVIWASIKVGKISNMKVGGGI